MSAFFALLMCVALTEGSFEKKLQVEMPAMMAKAGVPGMTVACFDETRVLWQGAFGVKNVDTKVAMAEDTVFEAASLSKPVFAYLCMRLVERGLLNLDRPVAEDLPNQRMAHDDRYLKITPRMILSHRTGLPNWGGEKLELGFEPGSSFQYSGEGYVYLSQLVEKLTGENLETLFKREVFEPLGMRHSAFTWQPAYDDQASSAHDRNARPQPQRRRPNEVNTASSLYTTAGDYARFTIAIMKGQGLNAVTHSEMLRSQGGAKLSNPAQNKQEALYWALGWGIVQPEGDPIFWHWGDNGNFKSWIIWHSKTKRGFTYFANSTHGHALLTATMALFHPSAAPAMDQLDYESMDAPGRQERMAGERFVEQGEYAKASKQFRLALAHAPGNTFLTANLRWCEDLLSIQKTPIVVASEHLQPMVGKYGPRQLSIENGHLHYQREGRSRYKLIPLGKNTFALEGSFGFRIEIITDGDGQGQKIVGHYINGNRDESPRDGGNNAP